MKTHAAVDNLCVYGDPYKTYTVAIIVPSKVYLEMIGHNLGKDMCYDSLLNDLIDFKELVYKWLYIW